MRYLIILSIFLVGCSPCKYVSKHPECFPPAKVIEKTNTIIKDSITYIPADSSIISLLFECDSNNNVLMRTLNETSSKGIETKIQFIDNRLDLSMYVDSIAKLNRLVETIKSKETEKVNPINTILEEQVNKLTNKVSNRNKIILILSGMIILIISLLYLFRKFL